MTYLPFRKEDEAKYRIFFQRGYTAAHKGTDWGMNNGTPLIAIEDGTITLNTKDQYGALFTRLLGSSGKQYEYVHLSRYATVMGQFVRAGDVIGYAGATGNATGPHLHLNYYTRAGAERSDFMKLNPKYFNSQPNQMVIQDKTYEEAKSGFNDLFGFFKVHGIRGDLDTYVKQGGDSVQWMLLHGRSELRGMFDSIVRERNALKQELADVGKNGDVVSAIDRLTEVVKNKP